jgi:hypothetical protein
MLGNKELSMNTGKKALQLGLYASACCHQELLFDAGDLFTRCLTCSGETNWKLLEPVVSWQELEQMEETSLGDRLAA